MLVKQGLSDESAKTQHGTDQLPPAIRGLSVFAHLPDANLAQIAARLERIECGQNEIVINQGDVGAHYYIIEKGQCEVLREDEDMPPKGYDADSEPEETLLAVLRAGDAFGEEALVSGAPRNATVRMKSDGVLLRLNRRDFGDLVKTPLVHSVDPTRAEDLVALGAVWLDIRTAQQHRRNGLERSVNIPLRDIRERIDELQHDRIYVVYCDDGQASAAATFLLCARGFAACCLGDGLTANRPATRNIASVPTELEELGAELIEANEQLEQAIQVKAQADAELDVELLSLEGDQRDEHARLTERLRGLEDQAGTASTAFEAAKQRKLELERRIREGTAAAAARKREAQAQLEKMRRDAELRLAAEKQRLQVRYKEAAEQLQELERERQALETRFEDERKRLERELDDARAKVENEARSVREALESDRRAAEQRAVQIRDAATRAEKQLRDETESALKDEQARLASEFARSVAEQEQARHDLEEAEGARRSAEREVIQVQSAIAAAVERRRTAEAAEREAEQARRRAEEARLRAEREAAEARLIAAEARRQLAQATAKVHGNAGAAAPKSPLVVAAAAPAPMESDEPAVAKTLNTQTPSLKAGSSDQPPAPSVSQSPPEKAADRVTGQASSQPAAGDKPIAKLALTRSDEPGETDSAAIAQSAEAIGPGASAESKPQQAPETGTLAQNLPAAHTGETAPQDKPDSDAIDGEPNARTSSPADLTAQPAKAETVQPANAQTIQPARAETAQPANAQTIQPARAETAQPANAQTVQPAKAETAQPANAQTIQPARAETAQPAKAQTIQPAKAETAQPAKAQTVQPAKAETAQPAKAQTVQPARTETAQPANAQTVQPARAETAQPANAQTVQPAKAETDQPAKAQTIQPAKAETAQPAQPAKAETVRPVRAESAQPAKAESIQPAKAETAQPGNNSGTPPSAELSLDDLEMQLTQARQAVETAKQKEQRFAKEEKTAAVSKAKEEELRLKLFEEMENWVEEEREKSERDRERYIRELERLQANKAARQQLQQDVNAGLMADVQSVLSRTGADDDDPFEEFIRMRTMAEETGRVVQDAKASLEAQKAKSEKALAEANARLDQTTKPKQDG